jgi:hypothetical protein
MQVPKISKWCPAIFAVVFCSGLIIVRAADTPAQAAARAALLQQMNEMPPQPATPAPIIVTPSAVKVETPVPVVVAPPVVQVPAPASAPAPSAPMFQPVAVPALDSDAQAKARAALLQKMSEIESQSPATPMPAPEKVVVKETQKPLVKMETPAPVVMQPKPAVVAEPTVKPIETPALPISATKEERLQALLQKYKTDQITPEEYHTERTKIMAER